MNTGQLIVLWYGGLALLARFLSGLGNGIPLVIGLGVLFLLILTGWRHPQRLNHRKLLLAIVLPSCLVGIFAFMADTTEYDVGLPQAAQSSSIPPQNIELVNPQFRHRFFLDQLAGQIKNNSSQRLTRVKLRVSLADESGTFEDFEAVIKNINIPPGETRPFSQTVGDPHARFKKHVKWSYQVESALGAS
jgi:4-amino-4-deoxy-L-arabinose transferase-like glycosyltransferase